MRTVEEIRDMVNELPPDRQQEVADFVEFLLNKQRHKPKCDLKLDWRGALMPLREQYSSVELQHKALEWWSR